jgi:hypothetical protein
MKTTLYSFIAAAAALGFAQAQTAYTTPVGYETTTLVQGFNNVGLRLHAPTKAAGTLNVIGTGSVQDTAVGVDFLTSLGAVGTLHILEITSGPALGLVTEISTWTDDTITTVDNLFAAGVVDGNTYRIRKAPTLENIFGTNPDPLVSVLFASNNAALADIVWVPTATPGVYTQYFMGATGAFRRVSPAGATPNVPLVYLDGIFIQRKNTGTKDLIVSGEVKTDNTNGGLVTGFNYVGTVYPVGSTIQNIGLDDDLTVSNNAAIADIVWIPTGTPGQYTQVYRGTTTWRTVSPAGVAPTINLPGAMFIQRRAAATSYDIVPPSTWDVNP